MVLLLEVLIELEVVMMMVMMEDRVLMKDPKIIYERYFKNFCSL